MNDVLKLPPGIEEAMENTFARWGLPPPMGLTETMAGKILAISLGLGALFNEDADAERRWMRYPHSEFKTRPITMVLAGRLDDVLAVVNRERNL